MTAKSLGSAMPLAAMSISAFSHSKAKPVLRAIVPMGTAIRSSSGYCRATSWVIRAPSDKPTRNHGRLTDLADERGAIGGKVGDRPRRLRRRHCRSDATGIETGAAIAVAQGFELRVVDIAGLIARGHPNDVRALAVLKVVQGRAIGIYGSLAHVQTLRLSTTAASNAIRMDGGLL